jgi:hypothetical protein
MLLQQLIAIIIIVLIIWRISARFQKKEISSRSFWSWLIFWLIALLVVIFLRQIDFVAARIGIIASGIELLVYVSVVLAFYLIFRIFVRLDKIEKDITKIVREVAIKEVDKTDKT